MDLQLAFLAELDARLSVDDRVTAAWLEGSFGRGHADRYSDIDLHLLLDPAAAAEFKAAAEAWLEALCPLVLFRWMFDDRMINALTAAGLRLDIWLHDDPPAVVDPAAIRVIKEIPGALVREIPNDVTPPAIIAARLDGNLREFWRCMAMLPVVVGRAERIVSFMGLDVEQGLLINILCDGYGIVRNAGVKRLNPFLPDALRQVVEEALDLAGLTLPSLIRAHLALAELVQQHGPIVAARHGLAYPAELERTVLTLVHAELAQLALDSPRAPIPSVTRMKDEQVSDSNPDSAGAARVEAHAAVRATMPDATSLTITYVGHATTLIELDGVRLLTDPILRNRVLHLQRRANTEPEELWLDQVDAVLISHLHWDHVDLPSLLEFDRAIPLLVPAGSGALFRKQGFVDIRELEVGDRVPFGPVTVEAVYALHSGGRVFSGIDAHCLGYIAHGTQSVYFAGDTDLFPGMNELCADLDVALLPVWGWGPTLGPGHLNPYRAALALRMLAPRIAIPIHWGTFHPIGLQLLRPAFLDEPPHAFAQFARQLAPHVQVPVVEPGGVIEILPLAVPTNSYHHAIPTSARR